jgi:hypothetical protein
MARDIGGLWKIIQPNGESFVTVSHVSQPDGAFTLEAQQVANGVRGRGGGNVTREFPDQGERVSFVINWDNHTAGAYTGAFDGQGHIFGSTFDLLHPGSTAEWHSDRTF